MDFPSKKFEKWTIETAQMKHSARRYSMGGVMESQLRKLAAEYGIDNYKDLLSNLRESPETYESMTEQEREFSDIAASAGTWIVVGSCIKPYIHLSEWLELGPMQIDGLSSAAQEINPHLFEIAPEQEKKTDE